MKNKIWLHYIVMNFLSAFSFPLMAANSDVALGPNRPTSCAAALAYSNLQKPLEELAHLLIRSDEGRNNPLDLVLPMLEKDAEQKKLELEGRALERHGVDQTQLEKWLHQLIEDIQSKNQRDRASEAVTKNHENQIILHDTHPAHRGTFNLVKAGETEPFPNGSTIKVEEPFFLMNAPVSQYIWKRVVELMQENLPSSYYENWLAPEPSYFANRPLNPVENVHYYEVSRWLEGLNELSRRGAGNLELLFLAHQQGDLYDLPSADQLEWNLYTLTGILSTGEKLGDDQKNPLEEYAWLPSESVKKLNSTFEIGTKSPMVTSTGSFWDVVGNVEEMTKDIVPVMAHKECVSVGGSFESNFVTSSNKASERSPSRGFRLIRKQAIVGL